MDEATKTESASSEGRGSSGGGESSPIAEVVEFVEYGIRSQMRERPYTAMAAAFGLGYVLGGGLPKFAVKLISGMGVRYAASKYLDTMFPSDR